MVKGWRKTEVDEYGQVYYENKKGDRIGILSMTFQKGWSVYFNGKTMGKYEHKTKKEALAYARRYMKKH